MVVELTHTSLPKWPPVAVVTGLGLGAAPFESPDGPCPWLYHMPIMKYVCVGGRGGRRGVLLQRYRHSSQFTGVSKDRSRQSVYITARHASMTVALYVACK